MKTKTVAIMGRNRIENYREFKLKVERIICTLIEEDDAETFLFKGGSFFSCVCLEAVTAVKEKYYPLIKRVYIADADEKLKDYHNDYDEVYNPYGVKKGGYNLTVNRGLIMVDMCDILAVAFDKDYLLLKGTARSTKKAVGRALEQNKRVINLFEV